MWTPENRPKYNRDKLRYPSDLTDEEWSHLEPEIPPAKHGGRGRDDCTEQTGKQGGSHGAASLVCLAPFAAHRAFPRPATEPRCTPRSAAAAAPAIPVAPVCSPPPPWRSADGTRIPTAD